MTKRLVVATALAAFSIPIVASAADLKLPAKAPPSILSPAPIVTWSGFYGGLNLGYGWGSTEHTVTVGSGLSSGSFDTDGAILGGTLGYQQQFGQWVYGFEVDVNKTWMKGDLSHTLAGGTVTVGGVTVTSGAIGLGLSSELTWLSTVRGRVGYDYNSWLFYMTGGAAFGNVTSAVTASAGGISGSAAQSDTRLGWAIGVGVEHKFTPALSAKAEYLYVDLGKNNQLLIDSVDYTTNIFRVGVNYRLGDLVH